MSLAISDLVTWINDNAFAGVSPAPATGGNWMPDQPGEIVVVSAAGGGESIVEGAFEPSKVHIRSRAASDTLAETLARKVHALIMGVENTFTMGTTRVLWVDTTAGAPSYLSKDDSDRVTYLGEYVFMAGV